jgi:hypothetical protein
MLNDNNDNNNKLEKESTINEKEIEYDKYIQELKNKENIKIFNKEELNILKYFKKEKNRNKNQKLNNFLINYKEINVPIGSRKNLVENNIILIRPQIYASIKQLQYENQNNNNKEYYLLDLLKKLKRNTRSTKEKREIIAKLKKFEVYINNLHLKKLEEKFGAFKKIENKNEKNDQNHLISLSIKSSSKSSDSIPSYLKKNYRKLTIYDKIFNCCFRSPLKPYSKKKIIWGGEDGEFRQEFQDNREY